MRPRSSPPGTRLVAGIVLGCVGVLTGVTEAQQNLLRGRPVTVSSDLGAEWNQCKSQYSPHRCRKGG